MNPKASPIILIFLIAVMALASCSRPASKAPAATPTIGPGEGIPVPAGTQTMGMFDAFATQTAIAQLNPPVSEPPTPTPEPLIVVVTDTPAPLPLVTPAEPPLPLVTPAEPPLPLVTPAEPPLPLIAPSPTAGLPATYTLQKDEFPYCIARRFDVNPYELLSLNGLSQSQTIFSPGLVLKIPQTGHGFPGERAWHDHPTTYTVKAGDTIYKVACYFGDVDPLVIAQVNNLEPPYTLTAGDVLNIP